MTKLRYYLLLATFGMAFLALLWKLGGLFRGFDPNDERFGIKFNHQRIKFGVPVLPSDWVPDRPSLKQGYRPHKGVHVVEVDVGQQIWSKPDVDGNRELGHFEKHIEISLAKVLSEADRYRFLDNGTEYILRCEYTYGRTTPWTFDLIVSAGDQWIAREISMASADSVCDAWRKKNPEAECPPILSKRSE